MADSAFVANEIPEPDISHLVTEDDEPVDNIFSEKQQRLLTEPLYTSWKGADGKAPRFFALANVGLFFSLHEPPLVPDAMLSLDVTPLPFKMGKKAKSYFVWEYGKPPDIVIEVVSNREGGEEAKLEKYARIGIPYAVIFDPDHYLGQWMLRAYELHGRTYVDFVDPSWLPALGLGLILWIGTYEDVDATWLRWCDRHGNILATGTEAAEAAQQSAEAAQQSAEAAQQAADVAQQSADAARTEAEAQRERAERLAARLRELGLDP